MKLLFKISGEETKLSNIGDTDFKNHYPSINKNLNWPEFKTYIRQSTIDFIIPFIGIEFYNKLVLEFESENTDELFDPILSSVKDSIAYFTIYNSAPFINSIIGEQGIQQNAAKDGNTSPVNQWRFKQLRWNSLINAYKAIDRALYLLEINIEDEKLSSWRTSLEYKRSGTPWFRGTRELSEYQNINNSRRSFISLTPYLKKAESLLSKKISKEAVDELLSNQNEANNKDLIDLCRKFISEKSLTLAIPHLRMKIEGDGIMVITQTDSMDTKEAASDIMIHELEKRTELDASESMKDILNYLENNLEDFPIYKEYGYIKRSSRRIVTSPGNKGGMMIS